MEYFEIFVTVIGVTVSVFLLFLIAWPATKELVCQSTCVAVKPVFGTLQLVTLDLQFVFGWKASWSRILVLMLKLMLYLFVSTAINISRE